MKMECVMKVSSPANFPWLHRVGPVIIKLLSKKVVNTGVATYLCRDMLPSTSARWQRIYAEILCFLGKKSLFQTGE